MPSKSPLWVMGAGGHGKVVVDALRSQGQIVEAFFDDNSDLIGTLINGVKVVGRISDALGQRSETHRLHIAIGSNAVRAKLATGFGQRWGSAIHRKAWLSDGAKVSEGAMIGAHAIVQCDSEIGSHTIINTAAVVEHDVRVSSFVHLAPGTIVGGGAAIAEGAFIGIGAIILPGIKVGKWSTIGAGAVVTCDVPDGTTVVGIPAREVNRRSIEELR